LCLSRALRRASCLVSQGQIDGAAIVQAARAEIDREPLAKLEYARLCDPTTLEDLQQIGDSALLALAARIGKARLIDNTILKR
jgi:pantothenate synthetase